MESLKYVTAVITPESRSRSSNPYRMPAERDYGFAVKRRLFASSPTDRVVEYIQVEAKVSNFMHSFQPIDWHRTEDRYDDRCPDCQTSEWKRRLTVCEITKSSAPVHRPTRFRRPILAPSTIWLGLPVRLPFHFLRSAHATKRQRSIWFLHRSE
jgi:hypothetical protein